MSSADVGRASEELLDVLLRQFQRFDTSRHDWLMYESRTNLDSRQDNN